MPNDGDGTRRVVKDVRAGRSQEQSIEAAEPACPRDDELGVGTGIEQRSGGALQTTLSLMLAAS